ncbi:hypothetical protein SCLCIDRAFT_537439 [Scleroderma citrinum Foug A]|uniref:Uncharacterized protein n=1 Tax=Scleroderma citrinum Foug A TaxID=1036808 RepID=A0A0C3AJZ2_9AGAM|nr:hypothetical protein SCLCIDRAFT_537439 [Scleroderma citrinum Foug A]
MDRCTSSLPTRSEWVLPPQLDLEPTRISRDIFGTSARPQDALAWLSGLLGVSTRPVSDTFVSILSRLQHLECLGFGRPIRNAFKTIRLVSVLSHLQHPSGKFRTFHRLLLCLLLFCGAFTDLLVLFWTLAPLVPLACLYYVLASPLLRLGGS